MQAIKKSEFPELEGLNDEELTKEEIQLRKEEEEEGARARSEESRGT
jgi:hypothetical protein